MKHRSNYFLWMDMEMTGLEVEKEVILEVASVITDLNFNIIDQYEAILYQPKDYLDRMDQWNKTQHTQSGLIDKIPLGKLQQQVEQELIHLIKKYFDISQEKPILCGNSISQDRSFINYHLPQLAQILHYRILDVSSWKIIFENIYGKKFEKKKNHRALDDIIESIEELKFYLTFIQI